MWWEGEKPDGQLTSYHVELVLHINLFWLLVVAAKNTSTKGWCRTFQHEQRQIFPSALCGLIELCQQNWGLPSMCGLTVRFLPTASCKGCAISSIHSSVHGWCSEVSARIILWLASGITQRQLKILIPGGNSDKFFFWYKLPVK